MTQIGDLDKARLHYFSMFFAWLFLAHVGVWTQFFKHYPWANLAHMAIMTAVSFITLMSGYSAIIEYGVPPRGIIEFHGVIGIIIMGLVSLQSIGGFICWNIQKSSKVRPDHVYKSNLVHRILGWFIVIIAMLPMLIPTRDDKPEVFIPFITASLLSYFTFFVSKFITKRVTLTPSAESKVEKLIKVSNTQDLASFDGRFFTFGNLVYDSSKLISIHPGGYELIKEIEGREVDQYIFGTQQLESVEKMVVYAHSENAIKLAGPPIGYLATLPLFANMTENNNVKVSKIINLNQKDIFIIYFRLNYVQDFNYLGYSDLSQLGKFFTITINQKVTRLYTSVNFMDCENIFLMKQITGILMQKIPSYNNSETSNNVLNNENNEVSQFSFIQQCKKAVPLILKKYPSGELTSVLLQEGFKGTIRLSEPRGRGLLLDQMPSGKFVFFATGTGLNTFCDLIDLLFKQYYCRSHDNETAQKILKKNPVLSSKLLWGKIQSLDLYLSVQDTIDIHEITAYQLNILSAERKASIFLKATQSKPEFLEKYSKLTLVKNRFEHFVPEVAKNLSQVSQIYVCGPTRMARSLVNEFKKYKIPSHRYRIM